MDVRPDRYEVVRPSGTRVGTILTDPDEAAEICKAKPKLGYTVKTLPGGPSDVFNDYALEIACQRMTGKFCDSEGAQTFWTERGHELEPDARDWYSFIRDRDVEECGLILTDAEDAGASVDGLVNDDPDDLRQLEIKCFKRTHHMNIIRANKVPDEHIPQIQAGLAITERQFCDFVLFHPFAPVPGWIIPVERDEEFIARYHECRAIFNETVDRLINEIESLKVAA